MGKVIQQLGGQELEKDYPYKATNQRCSFSASKAVVTVSNSQLVGRRNEKEMLNFVGSTGPLSICHDAASWSSYKSGIMTSCRSGGGHCTQIVGYGTENGRDYWKVRNSWGSRFGENGHARLIRDKNLCGLNQHASTVDVTVVNEVSSAPVDPSFEEWAIEYGFNSTDETMRENYETNLAEMKRLREEHPETEFAVNPFSGMSWEEFSLERT